MGIWSQRLGQAVQGLAFSLSGEDGLGLGGWRGVDRQTLTGFQTLRPDGIQSSNQETRVQVRAERPG